jgi:putative transposase
MSSKPRRIFGREFKLQIVRQLDRGEKRLGQLCREHQLAESLVRRWREQYEAAGENVWLDERLPVERDPETRIAELEAALGRAHLEIDLLRRALEKGGSPARRNGR